MSTTVVNNKGVLNFDIFKTYDARIKDAKFPQSSNFFLNQLYKFISKMQGETLDNFQLGDTKLMKLVKSLENDLNVSLTSSLNAIHKEKIHTKELNLGELYQFAIRNNLQLRNILNGLYLSTRVFKNLYKENAILQNLEMRLTHTRCKIMSTVCQGDGKRTKLRHLKLGKRIDSKNGFPRKINFILKKCSKELSKYLTDDPSVTREEKLEFHKLFTNNNVEKTVQDIAEELENAFTKYFQNLQHSPKVDGYIKGLKEICESQKKTGDLILLDYCDQELAMEYLVLKSGDVLKDFLSIFGKSSNSNKMKEDTAYNGYDKNKDNITKMDSELLDLEDFQLVDDWEEQGSNNVMNDNKGTFNNEQGNVDNMSGLAESKSEATKRKRRSRFAPIEDEPKMKQNAFGFCSTFVDEDGLINDSQLKPISENNYDKIKPLTPEITQEHMRIYEEDKEVVKPVVEQIIEPIIVPVIEPPVTKRIDKADICKNLLKELDDSLNKITEAYYEENIKDIINSVKENWRTSGAKGNILENINLIGKEIYSINEKKIRDIEKECSKAYQPKKSVTKAVTPVAVTTQEAIEEKSPSPTPFDQTIEASLRKSKRTDNYNAKQPIVAKRVMSKNETGSSPEKSRFRAIMLSYKRDKEAKNKEAANTTTSNSAQDSKIEQFKEENKSLEAKNMDLQVTPLVEVPLPEKCNVEFETNKSIIKSNAFTEEKIENEEQEPDRDVKLFKMDLKTKITTLRKKEDSFSNSESDNSESFSSSSSNDNEEDGEEKRIDTKDQEINAEKDADGDSRNVIERKEPQILNKIQWLLPSDTSSEAIAPTIFQDNPTWEDKKVFVIDAVDQNNSIAFMVKNYLQKNGAILYDHSNYKQAGRDLYILVHQQWRTSNETSRVGKKETCGTSQVSLLFLKNNSGIHFLSYDDLENVSQFTCQYLFPNSRSCIFLDELALINTHPENIRNMLEYMVNERQNTNRIWSLKIMGFVYRSLEAKINSEDTPAADLNRLKEIDSVLKEYSQKFSEDPTMSLVEIQTQTGELSDLHTEVLNQQNYLQKKFRHFCILTDKLQPTQLDIRLLSNCGVAVLTLITFLSKKIGKYVVDSVA